MKNSPRKPSGQHTHYFFILQQRNHLRRRLTSCCSVEHPSLLQTRPAQQPEDLPSSGDSSDSGTHQPERLTCWYSIKCKATCIRCPQKPTKHRNTQKQSVRSAADIFENVRCRRLLRIHDHCFMPLSPPPTCCCGCLRGPARPGPGRSFAPGGRPGGNSRSAHVCSSTGTPHS